VGIPELTPALEAEIILTVAVSEAGIGTMGHCWCRMNSEVTSTKQGLLNTPRACLGAPQSQL